MTSFHEVALNRVFTVLHGATDQATPASNSGRSPLHNCFPTGKAPLSTPKRTYLCTGPKAERLVGNLPSAVCSSVVYMTGLLVSGIHDRQFLLVSSAGILFGWFA